MPPPPARVRIAAITENMLKRKWSTTILRHLQNGLTDPVQIITREPELTHNVMSERLRTMLRYGLVARFPPPHPLAVVEYRVSYYGKKVLEILNSIEQLEEHRDQRDPLRHTDAPFPSLHPSLSSFTESENTNEARAATSLAGKSQSHHS